VGLASVTLGVAIPLLVSGSVHWKIALTLILATWIVGSHAVDFARRLRKGIGRIPLAYLGMSLAHIGFAMALLGVALTSQLSAAKDLRMSPGAKVFVGNTEFEFVGTAEVPGPNYIAQRGTFSVSEGNHRFAMQPEKRTYLATRNVMTEAAIDAGFLRDIYITLGEPIEGGDWAVRLQVKPFVRWIWLGGLMMAFGGGIAITDARYRRLRKRMLVRNAAAAA
jgi:cytochrome c-type biogenesis protein CcmF